MQMDTEARAWLDATVRRILARHPLGDAERAGITYELMSHLHAAGEARAKAAGRGEVSRPDLEAALAASGGEDGLAAAFVLPLARPIERVGPGLRLAAFAIDAVAIVVGLLVVHGALTFLLGHDVAEMGQAEEFNEWWGLMPWGIHDPTMPAAGQALIAVASAAVVLGYFTWLEGSDGRSLGKRALRLRVMRADGKPMTYRDALLRNATKLSPPILAFDTLAAFGKDRQRVSDRIANTLVVKA